jgi:3-deoxy-D-manno-octulosonic acid kinase
VDATVDAGYQQRQERDGRVLVADAVASVYSPAWFEAAPAGAGGLHGGRGSVAVIETAAGALVRRDYLRGGLPRHLSRDAYLWTGAARTRGFREFRLLLELRAAGLPVPEPVAARYVRHGPVYRATLLMRLIPAARTLGQLLAAGAEPAATLAPALAAVAQIHAAGVWHADLNADNLLVDADDRVWLIDFDRARAGVTARPRLQGNLDRLLRSLRKRMPAPVMARIEAAWPQLVLDYRAALGRHAHG